MKRVVKFLLFSGLLGLLLFGLSNYMKQFKSKTVVVVVPADQLTKADWKKLCAPYMRKTSDTYVDNLMKQGIPLSLINKIEMGCINHSVVTVGEMSKLVTEGF